jgi:hypothetical protein
MYNVTKRVRGRAMVSIDTFYAQVVTITSLVPSISEAGIAKESENDAQDESFYNVFSHSADLELLSDFGILPYSPEMDLIPLAGKEDIEKALPFLAHDQEDISLDLKEVADAPETQMENLATYDATGEQEMDETVHDSMSIAVESADDQILRPVAESLAGGEPLEVRFPLRIRIHLQLYLLGI